MTDDATHRFLVFSNPVAGREDDYEAWYDGQHLPDLLRIPGFVAAQRFRLAPTDPPQDLPQGFLAIYEVRTDDLAATQQALAAVSGTDALVVSDALDRTSVLARWFEAIGPRVTG